MPFVQTKITSADVRITTGPAIVYGILAAAAGTGGLWQLNDSSDDSGTDMISGFAQASGETYIDLSNKRHTDCPIYGVTNGFHDTQSIRCGHI